MAKSAEMAITLVVMGSWDHRLDVSIRTLYWNCHLGIAILACGMFGCCRVGLLPTDADITRPLDFLDRHGPSRALLSPTSLVAGMLHTDDTPTPTPARQGKGKCKGKGKQQPLGALPPTPKSLEKRRYVSPSPSQPAPSEPSHTAHPRCRSPHRSARSRTAARPSTQPRDSTFAVSDSDSDSDIECLGAHSRSTQAPLRSVSHDDKPFAPRPRLPRPRSPRQRSPLLSDSDDSPSPRPRTGRARSRLAAMMSAAVRNQRDSLSIMQTDRAALEGDISSVRGLGAELGRAIKRMNNTAAMHNSRTSYSIGVANLLDQQVRTGLADVAQEESRRIESDERRERRNGRRDRTRGPAQSSPLRDAKPPQRRGTWYALTPTVRRLFSRPAVHLPGMQGSWVA